MCERPEQRQTRVDHRGELAGEDRDVLELDLRPPKPGILMLGSRATCRTSARWRWACSPSGGACWRRASRRRPRASPRAPCRPGRGPCRRRSSGIRPPSSAAGRRRRRSSSLAHRSSAISMRDRAALHERRRATGPSYHAVLPAGLHQRVDLVGLALTDEVADGRRGDQHLGGDRPARAVGGRAAAAG